MNSQNLWSLDQSIPQVELVGPVVQCLSLVMLAEVRGNATPRLTAFIKGEMIGTGCLIIHTLEDWQETMQFFSLLKAVARELHVLSLSLPFSSHWWWWSAVAQILAFLLHLREKHMGSLLVAEARNLLRAPSSPSEFPALEVEGWDTCPEPFLSEKCPDSRYLRAHYTHCLAVSPAKGKLKLGINVLWLRRESLVGIFREKHPHNLVFYSIL